MPKTKISEYSTTNSQNTDIQSINIDEGCAPSGINNAIRELMVHLKNFQTGASSDPLTVAGAFVASAGVSANTLTVTSVLTASGGTILSSTNTISGAAIISGNINSSGTNTFSGSQVISGNINATGTTNTFSGDVLFTSTGAVKMPVGTQAQRPGTPVAGMVRFNDDTDVLEVYTGSSWTALGSGGGGGITTGKAIAMAIVFGG